MQKNSKKKIMKNSEANIKNEKNVHSKKKNKTLIKKAATSIMLSELSF